ncbi:MAG TPA: penicillin-insensitive murein endopeptidase [Polyangiaceae bacterium]|jgi:penicillin-insensitive murein endopeptidase|nr:penicillin-insensitive murein endopeptidase [Polyangiaceae bacterium]
MTFSTGAFSTGAFPGGATHRPTARVASLGPAAMRFGRSVGSPTEGHLLGGAHLEETPYLRIEPSDTAGDVRWGLEPLVTMIDRAARQVRRQFPDAIMSVGHLSREGGGEIDSHRSHESGRDADIGFFVRSASGRQLLPRHFVQFRGDGTAASWPGAYFDDAKNWLLVQALVSDPEAHVTHLFVAAPLRARLLAYAERMGAPANVRMRAAEVLQQPHGSLPHDDHFHVRIGCPSRMSACVENPAARARHGSSPVARGRRGAAGRGLVTPAPTTHGPLSPLPPPSAAPTGAPGEDEPASEPDVPPASMRVPIDDVDG